MFAPWATITPSAPVLGTSISAVTEWDLFFRFRTQFSAQASHAAEEELGLTPDHVGRPAVSEFIRSPTRSSSGSTL